MRTGLRRWWILLRELHFLIFVLFCICSPLLIQFAWMSSGLLFKHLILKLIKAKLINFLKHHLKCARAFSQATTFLTVRAQAFGARSLLFLKGPLGPPHFPQLQDGCCPWSQSCVSLQAPGRLGSYFCLSWVCFLLYPCCLN